MKSQIKSIGSKFWNMLPGGLQMVFTSLWGFFKKKSVLILMFVILINAMVRMSENYNWFKADRMSQQELQSYRQMMQANGLVLKARKRERINDSLEFEKLYNNKIDSLWRQRFEQRERELLDSIKRLKNDPSNR